MITLEAYRVAIGVFGTARVGLAREVTSSTNCKGAALFFAILLLISGDVETNPGPKVSDEAREKLLSGLKTLKQLIQPKQAEKKLLPDKVRNALLKSMEATRNVLDKSSGENKVVRDAAYYKQVLQQLAKDRLVEVTKIRNVFKPDLKDIDNNNDNAFAKKHMIYDDEEISVFIRRIDYKKATGFNLHDYQYDVRVQDKKELTRKTLTIYNLITQLHQAIIDIITEIRTQLSPELHSQIYFCLIHPALGTNLPTGNYDLFKELPEDIANQVITIFHNLLISWQTLSLDSSFQIRIQVISVQKINKQIEKGFEVKQGESGASKLCARNILSNKTEKSLMCLPDEDSRFKNKCLPAVVLLGYYRKKYLRNLFDKSCPNEAQTYSVIQKLNWNESKHPKNNHFKRARAKLLELISELCHDLGYPQNGPYPLCEFLEKAADFLGIQVHVYSNQGNRLKFSHPSEFDDSKPLIYIYEEQYEKSNVSHVALILKIKAFLKNVGFVCEHCKLKRGYGHYCRKKNVMCFACKRFILSKTTTYVDQETKKQFCTQLPTTKRNPKICAKCDWLIFTDDCHKHHKNWKMCERGFFCNKCFSWQWKWKKMSLEALREEHICFENTCRLCFEKYNPTDDHLCRMSGAVNQKYMRNLAFFDFESYTQNSQQACSVCYEKEQAYTIDHRRKVEQLTEVQGLLGNSDQNAADESISMEVLDLLLNHTSESISFETILSKISFLSSAALRKHFLCSPYDKTLLTRRDIIVLIRGDVLDVSLVRCNDHINITADKDDLFHVPNYAVMYFETECRGNFTRVDFADPGMHHQNDLREVFAYKLDYLPDSITDHSLTHAKQRGAPARSLVKNSNIPFPVPVKINPLTEEESPDETDLDMAVDDENMAVDFLDNECMEVNDISDEEEDCEYTNLGSRVTSKVAFGKASDEQDISGFDVIDKFLLFICNERFRNYVFISHNGSAYDSQFIAQSCYRHGLSPKLITRSMRILQLTIPTFNITFIDSIQYVSGSLDSLTRTFHIDASLGKSFYPHIFNNPLNYGYEGKCPDLKDYLSFNDSSETIQRKTEFHKKLVDNNYVWNFNTEIAKYCDADVNLLCQAMCKFLQQSLAFQVNLNKKFRPNEENASILHPFSQPFLTISSWVYGIWRRIFLPRYEMYALRDEKGLTCIKSSKGEQEWVLYNLHRFPDEKVFSKFTSLKPASFDGKVVPDFYIPGKKLLGWFQGCYFHGHTKADGCRFEEKKKVDEGTTKNCFNDSFASVQARFKSQKKFLHEKYGFTEENFVVMYECEWNHLKTTAYDDLQSDKERQEASKVREFMAGHYQERPHDRLVPRDALRGGKVEAFKLGWEKAMNPLKKLLYLDFNSLYPSVSSKIDNRFPVGRPRILILKTDLAKLDFRDGKCYLTENGVSNHVKGVIHCKIVCPELEIPFLQYRVKQKHAEKSLSSICSTCTHRGEKVPCAHSDEEKAFVSTWTLDEIAYCITLGYRLLDTYEAYVYTETAVIFKDFLETLARYKIMYSGFPTEKLNTTEKETYVKEINDGMNWSDGDKINVSDIEDNVSLRNFYKLLSNSLLGKFGQDTTSKVSTVSITSQAELDALFWKEDITVEECTVMSDHVVEVSVKSKSAFNRPNLKSNAIVAAHVTAYARIEMDKAIRFLISKGIEIFYTDTDSLIVALPVDMPNPLPEGPCYNMYKNEIPDGDIESFHTLGPKIYQLTYIVRGTGIRKTMTKVKGFFISSERGREVIHDNLFKTFVANYLKEIEMQTRIGQWQIKADKKRQLKSTILQKVLKNSLFDKRVAFVGNQFNSLETLPYGYTLNMYNRLRVRSA